MARIRTIKPDFFTSETVTQLPFRARLSFIGLWVTYCDDEGRGRYNVRLIQAAVFPLDDLSAADVQEDLDAMERIGAILRYQVDGKEYFCIPGWHDHQYISKPTPSRLPDPPPTGASHDSPGEPGGAPGTPGESRETRVGSGSGSGSGSKTRPQLTLLVDLDHASRSDPMERFEEFYRAYPRRVQRRAAEKAWLKAVKLKIDPQSMIDSAVRFASTKQGTEVKYIPYPATWLNAGAYDDEAEPKRVAGGSVRRGTYGG